MSRRGLLIEAIDSITGDADRRKAERNLEQEYATLVAAGSSKFIKDGVAVEPINLATDPIVVEVEPVLPSGTPITIQGSTLPVAPPEKVVVSTGDVVARVFEKVKKPIDRIQPDELDAIKTLYSDVAKVCVESDDVIEVRGSKGATSANLNCKINDLINAFVMVTGERRA